MFRNLVQRVAPIAVLLGAAAKAPRAETPSRHHAALAPVSKNDQVVVFSGGCFWGVQAVFQHVQGVTSAVSGYAGGDAASAHYDRVSDGNTGHAESVRVTFDPAQVSLRTIAVRLPRGRSRPDAAQLPRAGSRYAISFGNLVHE